MSGLAWGQALAPLKPEDESNGNAGGARHERRGGAMMRRVDVAVRRFEVASGRGRWRSPCRRTVDCAPVRADGDYLRELALCRKVAGDVLVISGYGTEFFAGAFVRIEYDNGFSCALLEIVKRRNEVGVAGDEYDAVKILFHVVDEHLGSDVYVRAFLFGFPHCCDGNFPAGFARFLCKRIAGTESFIVALDDLQFRAIGFKGGEIYGLPHLRGWLRRVIVDAGCEVLDVHDFMFVRTGQKGLCERDHIQPLVPREPKQPVVQVESVDIHDSLFHHRLSERQGPDFRPALHRIAEAQRSVNNPSRGSARIVSNRIFRNKWGNSFSEICFLPKLNATMVVASTCSERCGCEWWH